MNAIWTWLKAKVGRIAASIGFLAASIDLDELPTQIAPVADYVREVVGHKGLAWIMAAAFLFSFGRHQYASMKVKNLQAQVDVLTQAHVDMQAKLNDRP